MEINWSKTVSIMRELTKEFDDVYLNIYRRAGYCASKGEDRGHRWLIHVLPSYGDMDLTEWQEKHLPKIRDIANEYALSIRMSSFQDDFAVMLHDHEDNDDD